MWFYTGVEKSFKKREKIGFQQHGSVVSTFLRRRESCLPGSSGAEEDEEVSLEDMEVGGCCSPASWHLQ